MSEALDHSLLSRPKQFFAGALRTVRGENTHELVEAFTSEMTLVAEGLCEDQSKLRRCIEDVRRDSEQDRQSLQSSLDLLDRTVFENHQEMEHRLQELGRRVEALERDRKKARFLGKWKLPEGFMPQLILLASILAGAWVLVTFMRLFL